MSLITRCSACGTMFKVVADQLKISQGWVRCGHCSEVFDAAAQMQPFEAPATSLAPGMVSEPSPVAPAVATESDSLAGVNDLVQASLPDPLPEPAASVPEIGVAPLPGISQASVPPASYVAVTPERAGSGDSRRSDFLDSEPPESVGEVSFVRDARRNAFWRRSATRGVLGVAAFLLGTVLLMQVALFQRNTLAAWQPWLSAGLQTLCAQFHCELGPAKQIESVLIDSSSFIKISPDSYRLSVVIKNAGTMALAMPSLELTLTDTQDQALLRRVLSPGEMGATGALAGGSEFSGMLALQISSPAAATSAGTSAPKSVASLRVAGYRVLAFYP